jgi:hypothetical protein
MKLKLLQTLHGVGIKRCQSTSIRCAWKRIEIVLTRLRSLLETGNLSLMASPATASLRGNREGCVVSSFSASLLRFSESASAP